MASSSTTGSTTSASNSNPWAPYDGYKDCTQGICSIYCPQWCYIIFPPPPPFSLEDDSGTDFSPLIIAVIGILASAFILVSYYTIISKYCRRRHNDDTTNAVEFHENHSVNNDAWQNGNNGTGLDEALIKSITVFKYKKGDGLVEGTDCSVCLSEFLEDESLRLLPKCNHAFHLPCIDTWLKSHSTCPLCRANIIASTHPQTLPPDHPPPQETMTRSETATVSVNQYQHRNNETVLVIHHVMESGVGEEEAAVVNLVVNDDHHHHVVVELPKTPLRGDVENLGELRHNNTSSHDHQHQVGVGVQVDQVQPIRRSVSMNSSVCQGPLSIADILRSNEDDDDDDDDQMEKNRTNRVLNLVRNSPFALKRTVSTGRFMFTRYGKSGNNSIIPN